jgi:DNA-binding CsgD family transcriptional regulator
MTTCGQPCAGCSSMMTPRVVSGWPTHSGRSGKHARSRARAWPSSSRLCPGPQAASPSARARALIGASALHRSRGEYAAAIPLARASAELRRALGDEVGLAESLVMLAHMLGPSEPVEATALAAEGAAIRRAHADQVGAAWAIMVLGDVAGFQANYGAARTHYEEVQTLRRGQPSNLVDAWILRDLGVLCGGEGNSVAARGFLDQALGQFRAWDDALGIAVVQLTLGDLLLREEDSVAGHALLAECRTRFGELGHRLGMAMVSVVLGAVLPADLLADIGEDLVTASWRSALARELPASAGLAPARPSDQEPRTLPGVGHRRAPDELTPREVQVLMLLAQRSTNREIGDALVLSVRTVERHITNIYAKTGLVGRRDARAYVERHQLDCVVSPHREAAAPALDT